MKEIKPMLPGLTEGMRIWFTLPGEQPPTKKQKPELFTFHQAKFTACTRNNKERTSLRMQYTRALVHKFVNGWGPSGWPVGIGPKPTGQRCLQFLPFASAHPSPPMPGEGLTESAMSPESAPSKGSGLQDCLHSGVQYTS